MKAAYGITLNRWAKAWSNPTFRRICCVSFLFLFANALFAHDFFQFIQAREGRKLDDSLLAVLPSIDFSTPIFILIYLPLLYIFFRALANPKLFIRFFSTYALLVLLRALAITLVPIEPPSGLILLNDPITYYFFYGKTIVTKDLFFSGHTATSFLVFLCLENKTEKVVTLCATLLLAILMLFQHIHYSVDIIAGLAICYLCYWFTFRKIETLR